MSLCADLGAPSYEGGQTIGTALTQDTTTKRTGAGSYKCVVSAASTCYCAGFNFSGASTGVWFCRTYLYIETLPNGDCSIFGFTQAGQSVVRHHIVLKSTGKLGLYYGAGQVGSDSDTLSTGQWYMVDIHTDNTQADGSCTIYGRLEGSVFASATDKNAQLTGELWIGGGLHTSFDDSTTGTWYFDDIAANDNSGSYQNSYPGSGKVACLRPNAAGAYSDGDSGPTPSQNPWDVTDDVPPNDATDYWIFAANNQDLFMNIEAASVGGIGAGDTINCVEVWSRQRGETALACDLENGVYVNGTAYRGSSMAIATTTWSTNREYTTNEPCYPWYIAEINPDDSAAWEPSDIDSLQIGSRCVDANPDVWVTAYWCLVDYTPAAPSSDVFFENRYSIEQGMKPQTAAGMSGVLVE